MSCHRKNLPPGSQRLGNIGVRERQQVTIDGWQDVALPPQFQIRTLLPDVDRLCYPTPEPVALAVHDGEAFVFIMLFIYIRLFAYLLLLVRHWQLPSIIASVGLFSQTCSRSGRSFWLLHPDLSFIYFLAKPSIFFP